MSKKVYHLATLIGVIPGTIAYTWLGITCTEALQGKDKLNFAIALLFFASISLLPFLMKARGKKTRNKTSRIDSIDKNDDLNFQLLSHLQRHQLSGKNSICLAIAS
jgi:hypothetical protein